jgi:hypothetical protein
VKRQEMRLMKIVDVYEDDGGEHNSPNPRLIAYNISQRGDKSRNRVDDFEIVEGEPLEPG